MNMKSFLLFIAAALIALTFAADRTLADNKGAYITWAVEEHDGREWRELDATQTGGTSSRHYDLENQWSDIPVCTTELSNQLRNNGRYYSEAIVENVYQERYYDIDPQMGRRYRVKIQNDSNCRIAVTLAVDGINSVDSTAVRQTGDDIAWIIDPGRFIYVKGFQNDSQTASEFYWTTPENAESDQYGSMGKLGLYVYFEEGYCARDEFTRSCPNGRSSLRSYSPHSNMGTGAGEEISNPVRSVHFEDLSKSPFEFISIKYSDYTYNYGWNNGYDDDYYNRNRDKREKSRYKLPEEKPASAPYYRYERHANRNDNNNSCAASMGMSLSDMGYGNGALIADLNPWGAAVKAGLKEGDVIVKVDGLYANTPGDVEEMIRTKLEGEYATIAYERAGQRRHTGVRMEQDCRWN